MVYINKTGKIYICFICNMQHKTFCECKTLHVYIHEKFIELQNDIPSATKELSAKITESYPRAKKINICTFISKEIPLLKTK